MFRFPDVFKVGVAVAPVPDQRLYDTIYQERYMGLPQENAEGYRRGSPIHFAEGLKGRLLIVHGSGDDNVHYQGTERLVNRLVSLGKPFDLMVYPNRSHAISEGEGTTLHVYSLIARYLVEHAKCDPCGASVRAAVIDLTRRGSVAVLRMTHGKANALDLELCEALTAQLDDCARSDAGALVLTGDGRMFSAGVDLLRIVNGGAGVRAHVPAVAQPDVRDAVLVRRSR